MAAITNLYSRIAYEAPKTGLIPLILAHSWDGNASSPGDTALKRIANYGFFVVSVGMRGRNSADGARDASGREIYDLYDALVYVRTNYAANVDANKAVMMGYSGGGGNALAAACKFPDAWSYVVAYFPMSDYGRNNPDGWWYQTSPTTKTAIETAVGDTPALAPNNYYARDATAAIQNCTGADIHLFHDEDDTSVQIIHSQRIGTAMAAAGLSNYTENYTSAADGTRWAHGGVDDMIPAEAIWKDLALAGAAWTIAASGTVTVIGYIVTKRFTIWLNANGTSSLGIDAVATVVYNTATDTYTVTPLTTGGIDVAITQGAKTGSDTNITVETEIIVS